jgi:hypothetical protein
MSAQALVVLEPGLDELDRLFDELLWAALPNPAALTFSELPIGLQGRRDVVFALALLNEGENECALILGLMRDALRRSPEHDVAPMLHEAWYYLRTSIDPAWQIDDGEPSIPAALAYLATIVRERIAQARQSPPKAPSDTMAGTDRAALLGRLRTEQRSTSPRA